MKSEHRFAFTNNDAYVSMGWDWNIGQLPHVRTLKAQTGFKVALMCHDIIPAKFPHLCLERVSRRFPEYLTHLANAADHVFCNSIATERDLRNVLQELASPIPPTSIVRLGACIPSVADDRPNELPPELSRRRFVLYVSSIERRKNHEVLYKAYVKLKEAGVSTLPIMVFVGKLRDVTELLNDLGLDPRIRGDFLILKRVTDPSLGWLYKNCLFTVFPSLYEGWGLPVAESLAFGKFCIASDRGALPEVGGHLVEHLDPWDVGAWANALHTFSFDTQQLVDRELRIRTDFVAPTWEEFGEQIFHGASRLIS